jgi:hypothetical protein
MPKSVAVITSHVGAWSFNAQMGVTIRRGELDSGMGAYLANPGEIPGCPRS